VVHSLQRSVSRLRLQAIGRRLFINAELNVALCGNGCFPAGQTKVNQ
jgi:hypothetical protein